MLDFVDIQKGAINPKEIPVGSIGYYVEKRGHRWFVNFGIVAEHYTNEICLWLLDTVDYRLINGVPAQEFKTPTRWMKLPKGWTYNTKLIKIDTNALIYEKFSGINVDITNPESILDAFNIGMLIKVQDKDYANFVEEIDNQKGYRIVRNYDREYQRSYVSLNWYQVYKTFEEAQAIVKAHKKELNRISELSDYDWAVEQIDNTLNFYYHNGDQEEKGRIRDWLLGRNNIEDIEIRASARGIEWKYWKHQKWKQIEL